MPNLAGIHDSTTDASQLRALLARMLDRIDLDGFGYERCVAYAHDLAVGNVLTGIENAREQPARDETRGLWLMLDGELYGAETLRARLVDRGRRVEHLDDAGLALDAYVTFGEDFLDELNGTWNLVLHAEAEGTTWLASDRLGSRILYVARDGRRLTFGSEIKAVVVGRPGPTRAGGPGLLQLFTGSQHFGRETWLEGIEVLDPGTVIRLGRGPTVRRRHFVLRFNEGDAKMSQQDYADGFAERLKAATKRCLRAEHPVAITLSGGLDSRSIALSIPPELRPIPALTYGDADSADVRYARMLAETIGLDFFYVEDERARLVEAGRQKLLELIGPPEKAPRGFFSTQIDRLVWRDEVMGDLMGTGSCVWHPLYAKHMNVMLNGACGDALTGSHLPYWMLRGPARSEVVERLRAQSLPRDRRLVERVLNRAFVERYWDEMHDRFAAVFDEIDADHPAAVADVWDMQNRQRRGAFSTFSVERYFCTLRSPYLDYELVDHLCSVPFKWRFGQRVYKRMLVHAYPEARHVPWAYTEGPITDRWLFEIAREVTLAAKDRLKRLAPWRRDETARWDFRDIVSMMREDREMSVEIERWMSSSAFPSDVFDAAGIRSLVEDFESGGGGDDEAEMYGVLAGLARAHEWFLDGTVPLPPQADPLQFGVAPPVRVASRSR